MKMEKGRVIRSQSEKINDLFDQIRAGLKKREEEGRPYFPASLGLCLHTPSAAFSVGTSSGGSMSTESQRNLKLNSAGNGLTAKLAGTSGSGMRNNESTPLFSPFKTPVDITSAGDVPPTSPLGKAPPVEISSSLVATSPSEKDPTNGSSWRNKIEMPRSFKCYSSLSSLKGKLNTVQKDENEGRGFKPLSWDAPSLGVDIFKGQRELQDKKRAREQIYSDKSNYSLRDFIGDDTFNGLGGGDGVTNHSHPLICKWKTEEADAFVEFANKYIPTGRKRRRLLKDDNSKESPKRL